jgi:tetratricopeptide (TPR) repeat protein
MRELFGGRHPMTLTAINNLAGSLRQQGRPEEALPYYREVLDGFVALYGEGHPRSLIARHNFGNGMLDVGRPDESVELHREALEGALQVFSENPFLIGNFELGLGKSELALGNAETALALLESAERLISDSTGADHHRAEEAREYAARARAAIAGAGDP